MAQDRIQISNLQVGNIVTFTCDSFSPHGVPTLPTIIKIRKDVDWSDLVSASISGNVSNVLNNMVRRVRSSTQPTSVACEAIRRLPHGQTKQWRQLFVKIARERNFDPLVASNWYKLRRGELQVRV